MVSCVLKLDQSPKPAEEPMVLQNLPYDLLLNIAQYLNLSDIDSLQLTCKSLYDFSITRPVFRKLAYDLLLRCRAIPMTGFQRVSDLSTRQLIKSVYKASHYERSWRTRTPGPIKSGSPFGTDPSKMATNWYKVVTAPPNEEVDWLSPITSSYMLCATKSGKVVCWDVMQDVCLAQWNPGEKWELWKCRVEFQDRMVYFTMAKVVVPTYDDERIMDFVLMRLHFPEESQLINSVNGHGACPAPSSLPLFSHVTNFRTTGVVMNVFLLDPPARLLSAFVWIEKSNTIGLYALLDWAKDEYVFIDTGVPCLLSSNWSCILHDQHIIIHSEECDAAHQHFYPLDLLRRYIRKLKSRSSPPFLYGRVHPTKILSKKFIFPPIDSRADVPDTDSEDDLDDEMSDTTHSMSVTVVVNNHQANGVNVNVTVGPAPPGPATPPPEVSVDEHGTPNPFPWLPWYPESAHFVRQWWPTLPGVPRLSCTVVLLASHDPDTHCTAFVLTQHYFRVPITHTSWSGAALDDEGENGDNSMMRLWYVSTPFEVVCVVEAAEEEGEEGAISERPRPLLAVDFGHAVWIEYVADREDRGRRPAPSWERKALRFVTFPSVGDGLPPSQQAMEGVVRTLEVPAELELDNVETINIDQSQGAVILSMKEGKIFILCYD